MTDFVKSIKEYVVDDRLRIELHDSMAAEIQRVVSVLGGNEFFVNGQWSEDAFRNRVAQYDEALSDLCRAAALIGHWAGPYAGRVATLPIERLSDAFSDTSGRTVWFALRWYPILLLMYAAGVSAVAADRYDALGTLFAAPLMTRTRSHDAAVIAAVDGFRDAENEFKLLAGRERNHVPRSEHLFELLRPPVEELLFLGSAYERSFDRFEVLFALEYAHRTNNAWPPIGRFGWKASYRESSPLQRLISEAEAATNAWAPLVAGLCGGSFERFAVVSKHVEECVVRRQFY